MIRYIRDRYGMHVVGVYIIHRLGYILAAGAPVRFAAREGRDALCIGGKKREEPVESRFPEESVRRGQGIVLQHLINDAGKSFPVHKGEGQAVSGKAALGQERLGPGPLKAEPYIGPWIPAVGTVDHRISWTDQEHLSLCERPYVSLAGIEAVAGQDEMNDEFVPDPRKDMVGHAVFAAEVDQGQLRRGLLQILQAVEVLFICKLAGTHVILR